MRPLTLTAVAAPSQSRPQISTPRFRLDAAQVAELVAPVGVAGLTEVIRPGPRGVLAEHFDDRHRVGLAVSDCPLVWDGLASVHRGTDFGARGIRGVAPDRHTVWALLEHDGWRVGAVSTHMHPGGWRPGNPWQYAAGPLIRHRWRAHADRISRRVGWLRDRADVVVVLGDINHPDRWTFPGVRRVSGPGLLYVGHVAGRRRPVHVTAGRPVAHPQAADHDALAVPITLRSAR